MSTSYYKLKEPVSFIRVEDKGPKHIELHIWVDGAKAGVLNLDKGDQQFSFIHNLFKDDDHGSAMRTSWQGIEGTRVTENKEGLADDMILLDEYGHILIVKQVRERAGANREDGMPTELFGFKDQ